MAVMKSSPIFAVILAGGQSSRLFPFNKVLSDLTGSGRSLISDSYHRIPIVPDRHRFILTVQEMLSPIRRQLRVPASRCFVDPARRGTWPALLWAMAHLRKLNPDAVLAVLTGDHVIQGKKAFLQAFRQGARLANEGPSIVMLGIAPSQDPATWQGFGCFQADAQGRVIAFEEKPEKARAEQMAREPGWLWNSGMFFFRLSTGEAALQLLQPEMGRVYNAVARWIDQGKKSEAAFQFEDFPAKIPHPLDPGHYVDNSIDYALMTPLVHRRDIGLSARAVTQTSFTWTDLGQWSALRSILKSDRRGTITIGRVTLQGDVRDCILVAEPGHQIVMKGGRSLIVAYAQKTALVMSADRLGDVKHAAQEALKHPDRLVMEHEVTDCRIQASGGRVIAIGLNKLTVSLSGKRLVVSNVEAI